MAQEPSLTWTVIRGAMAYSSRGGSGLNLTRDVPLLAFRLGTLGAGRVPAPSMLESVGVEQADGYKGLLESTIPAQHFMSGQSCVHVPLQCSCSIPVRHEAPNLWVLRRKLKKKL